MNPLPSWLVGLGLAAVIALLARRAHALSTSGAVAAWVAGTAAMGAGWSWGVILVAYFATSSLLSRFKAADKARRMEHVVAKHGPRDALQVLANGGAFVIAAIGYWIWPEPPWQFIAIGALSASAADTWATEIGSLSSGLPRSILALRHVPVGTSGGVSFLGIGAAVDGALLMAVLALSVKWPSQTAAAALIGGVAGCVLDSFLGASVQARFWCTTCGSATERKVHHCGSATTFKGGWRWLDNDGVNAGATLCGALVGAGFAALSGYSLFE